MSMDVVSNVNTVEKNLGAQQNWPAMAAGAQLKIRYKAPGEDWDDIFEQEVPENKVWNATILFKAEESSAT